MTATSMVDGGAFEPSVRRSYKVRMRQSVENMHSPMVMGCWQKPSSDSGRSCSTECLEAAVETTERAAGGVKPVKEEDLMDVITDVKNLHAFRRGRLIGKGGFAKVYEVTDLTATSGSTRVFADKVISKEVFNKRSTSKDKVKREIMLHKDLVHPNVVRFHKWFHDDVNNVHIILEFCSMKSLLHVMKARKVLTEPEVRYYMLQICEGVRYIHQRKILHRDLKLGNMFLTADMTLKIGDFGLATHFNVNTSNDKTTLCGTPNYIAPEVLKKQGHGIEADIWALGCMTYAMLVGTPPFETKSLGRTYAKIGANDYTIPERISQSAREFIQMLLHPEPSLRGHLNHNGHPQDLLSHPFFVRGFCPSQLPTATTSQPPKFPLENLYASDQSLKDSLFSPGCDGRKPSSPLSGISTDTDSGCSGVSNGAPSRVHYLRQRFDRLFSVHERHHHHRENLLIEIIEAVHFCWGRNRCDVDHHESERPPQSLGLLPIFVSKWIDYSNKYGFGYQLSDRSVGVIFNDSTRVCLSPDASVVESIDHRNRVATFPTNAPHPEHASKMRLVQYFSRYMDENLAEGVTASLCVNQMMVTTKHSTMVPQVVRWIRNNSTVIMELNNASIQINFIRDHAKLVFWGSGDPPGSSSFLISYLSTDRVPLTYNLGNLCRHALPPAIETKISQAIDVLKELTEKLLDSYSNWEP